MTSFSVHSLSEESWQRVTGKKAGIELEIPSEAWVEDDNEILLIKRSLDETLEQTVGRVRVLSKGEKVEGVDLWDIFHKDSQCPEPEGVRVTNPSEMAPMAYCLTGTTLENRSGVWKEIVDCDRANLDYVDKDDIEGSGCDRQYWTAGPTRFFIAQFNTKDGRLLLEEKLIKKILTSFKDLRP